MAFLSTIFLNFDHVWEEVSSADGAMTRTALGAASAGEGGVRRRTCIWTGVPEIGNAGVRHLVVWMMW
jgi:hypothetical protein